MKKALVIFNSKTGTTKKFGEEIGNYLISKNIESQVLSINDFNQNDVKNVDYILLGCWTSGLMLFLQHPQKEWVEFAQKLPDMSDKKIGLFTTYKLRTGSMFGKMKKNLDGIVKKVSVELKSRTGFIDESIENSLLQFIN
jgi:flavodoxin